MSAVEVHDGFRFLVRDKSETGHAMPVRLARFRNWTALRGDWLVDKVLRPLWRHLFGIVVTLVALTLTGGIVAGFLLDGDQFAALMSALIGLVSIAIGITYHSMGETR